jgi:PAS domain S-box-containing protein
LTSSTCLTVLAHMRDGVLVLDGGHRVVALNRAAEQLLGEERALVGLPAEQVLPGWSPPERRSGPAPETELVWRASADGLGRQLRITAVPLTDERGAPDGQALLLQEVADSGEAEALRHPKEFYESVVRNSPVAIVIISREFRVLSWNPAAERLFGYTPQEALGKNILRLVASADTVREDAEASSREVLMRNRVHSVTRRVRKDGSVVDVELLAMPVTVGDERAGFIAIYHDITDLQRARQAAEAANQAKSLFLATMSHEIRTPMNAIIGMTGLLLDTPLTPEQRDFVSTVRQSGDALLALLNDILDFSKIEAGKLELEHQPFDVRQCVESVLDLLAPRASEKGLDLGCLVAARTPQVLVGDAARLRQVLLNLVGNAVKFTEKGSVVVSVDVARQLGEPTGLHELHVSVQDTGPGIPPDKQAGLFQSFSQLDTSVTRRFGGTGLGLAICQRLVSAMGGRIWVESEGLSGRGATFHFTLTAPAAEQAPAVYLSPEQPLLRGRRILLVDDNATNRKILRLQLQAWGVESTEAVSGAEALVRLQAGERFDLAIIDHQMPLLDGPALVGLIRTQWDAKALPLVLVTSLGRKDLSTAGALSAVLTRPLKASQLYDTLVTCFSHGTVPVAQPRPAEPPRLTRAPGERLGDQHPLRILLAEDNPTNQMLALAVLERLGYHAAVVANGREALEALGHQRYDLVFMDMQMPEVDGLEATRRIRREVPADAQPWIVAMTANAMESDRRQCLEAGMDDYLSKPLVVDALIAALRRCQPRTAPVAPRLPAVPAPVAPLAPPPAPRPEALAPRAPEEPGLDPAALERLRRTLGRQAERLLPQLIDSAVRDMPGLLGQARTALERGQLKDLHRAAHTLKSNAAHFGATALAALCRDVEHRAKAETLEGLEELLGRCDAELSRTRGLLMRLRGSLPS